MIYAYTRQTPGKAQEERLKEQIELLKAEGPDKLIVERLPKKKEKKHEVFWKLFRDLRPGDTLIIPSIDRVSHSAGDFAVTMTGLMNKNVKLHVLDMGILDDSPEGLVRQQVIKAFADFEKAMIIERTQTGKAESRKDITFREGRPKKYSWSQLSSALRMLKDHSYKQVAETTGISVSTLRRAKIDEQARRNGEYAMTDADIREYEAAVASAEQMTLEDLL